jgi:hypothetical protein
MNTIIANVFVIILCITYLVVSVFLIVLIYIMIKK